MSKVTESLPVEWSMRARVNFERGRQKRISQMESWDDIPDERTAWIPVLNHGCVIVDEEDFEFLMQWNWTVNNWGYATRVKDRNVIVMHRVIMNAKDGFEVDHINHRTLDNRRSNLRICTVQQNQFNRWKSNSSTTSGYKGVSFCRRDNNWLACARLNTKTKNLGRYKTQEEAAVAYDRWAIENYGEFALLNFP